MRSPDSEAKSSTGPAAATTRHVRYQPKYALFSMLARLWILPSMGSILVILYAGNTWMGAGSWSDRLARVSFEQWIGLGILTAHFFFVCLALRYRRTESFLEQTVDLTDPDTNHIEPGSGSGVSG